LSQFRLILHWLHTPLYKHCIKIHKYHSSLSLKAILTLTYF
jgi:hypothetical protein